MRTVESFIIGFLLGLIVMFGFVVSREPPTADAVPHRVAARDTSCACCAEFVDYLAEHP